MDKIQQLKLTGMLCAPQEQESISDIRAIPFEERLGFIVDRELAECGNRSMQPWLRSAKLKQGAALEDIDFISAHRLDRSLIMELTDTVDNPMCTKRIQDQFEPQFHARR